MIEQATQNNTLIGVSGEDYLAPYKKGDLGKHKELCRVLSEQFGIALSLDDFMQDGEHENKTFYSVFPLQCAQVQGHDKLMVITCAYSLPEKDPPSEHLDFEIAPELVEFHLIDVHGGL